jgi:glucose 1-dehydrogenase
MSRSLTGKVALVTGAAKGIGRSVALELAEHGASLVLNDWQSLDELNQLAALIESMGSQALAVKADVSEAEDVEAMVASAIDRFGTIDILVNNAAYSIRKPVLQMTLEEASRSLAVSLWGPYLCCHYVIRRMVERNRGGSIVMVGSIHGERPYPNAAPYNMSKAGVAHLASSLALELAPHGIRVNTIAPGWINTPGERIHNTEEEIEQRGKTLPLRRLGSPEEVAKAVAFLCSEDASYITGATLRVDGGFSLKF